VHGVSQPFHLQARGTWNGVLQAAQEAGQLRLDEGGSGGVRGSQEVPHVTACSNFSDLERRFVAVHRSDYQRREYRYHCRARGRQTSLEGTMPGLFR